MLLRITLSLSILSFASSAWSALPARHAAGVTLSASQEMAVAERHSCGPSIQNAIPERHIAGPLVTNATPERHATAQDEAGASAGTLDLNAGSTGVLLGR